MWTLEKLKIQFLVTKFLGGMCFSYTERFELEKVAKVLLLQKNDKKVTLSYICLLRDVFSRIVI